MFGPVLAEINRSTIIITPALMGIYHVCDYYMQFFVRFCRLASVYKELYSIIFMESSDCFKGVCNIHGG